MREDQLSQVEAAQLLGRHKSWVNRRLALLERLCEEALAELRLGLVTPAQARQLTRLPRGNQAMALSAARECALTSRELSGVVDLLLASSTGEQTTFVLSDPRRALRQANDGFVHCWDPRLSVSGNRVAKRLSLLLDCLAKMHNWLPWQRVGELLPVRITEEHVMIYDRHLQQVASHSICRHVSQEPIRDPAHALPRDAELQVTHLRQRFNELGDIGRQFLEGLLQKQPYAKHQAQRVLMLLHAYQGSDVLQALERAVRYHAYSHAALEHILTHRAPPSPRGKP